MIELSQDAPGSLPVDRKAIRDLLPPPLDAAFCQSDDEGAEEHTVVDMDPVVSFNSNKVNMTTGSEAYDEDAESRGGPRMGGGRVYSRL